MNEQKIFLRQAQLIAVALSATAPIYMIILIAMDSTGYLRQIAQGNDFINVSLAGPIVAVFPIVLSLASLALRRIIVLKAGPVDDGMVGVAFVRSVLIPFAIIENGAVVGLLFGLLTANLVWPAVAFALTLAGFALHFPTKSRFEAFLNGANT